MFDQETGERRSNDLRDRSQRLRESQYDSLFVAPGDASHQAGDGRAHQASDRGNQRGEREHRNREREREYRVAGSVRSESRAREARFAESRLTRTPS